MCCSSQHTQGNAPTNAVIIFTAMSATKNAHNEIGIEAPTLTIDEMSNRIGPTEVTLYG